LPMAISLIFIVLFSFLPRIARIGTNLI